MQSTDTPAAHHAEVWRGRQLRPMFFESVIRRVRALRAGQQNAFAAFSPEQMACPGHGQGLETPGQKQ